MELKPHEIRYAGRPRVHRNPRQEKLMDYRRQNRSAKWRFNKENKIARKIWNRINRHISKQAIQSVADYEELDIVSLKKTSGWWTH